MRNYTPLRKVVHCALPGAVSAAAPVGAEPTSTGRCAPCGQRMISVDFQSASIITGEKVSFAALHPSPALAPPATPLLTC